jgi:UDP-glucose 4-epimerase
MKISLIGGSGVVGNGIFQILRHGHDVKCFDSKCFDFKELKYIDEKIFDCDCLIHAGGVTDEEANLNFDNALYRSSFSSNDLINQCLKNGCTKFIYISSIHVYGDLKGRLSCELLPHPKSNYALCHLFTESIFRKLCHNNKLKSLVLRVPTVYGFPADINKINRKNLIPFDFPRQLVEKGRIELNSNGLQKRNFCSNFKIGNIVDKWLKGESTSLSNVNGDETLIVRDFAYACIDSYMNITGKKGIVSWKEDGHDTNLDDFELFSSINEKETFSLLAFLDGYIKHLLYLSD